MLLIRAVAFLVVILTGRVAFAIGCSTDPSICLPPSGPCDKGQACINNICQDQGRKPPGTVCRSAAGACDVAETCDGSSDACPGNVFKSPGTECRATSGPCDIAEVCGGGAACPTDTFASGNICRASAGICDVAETCPGNSAACPPDAFASGNICRGSAGVCDVAETCPGNSAACPQDVFNSGTVCRASAGVCDVAETCPGNSAACPQEAFKPMTTVCRPAAAGGCDVAETCPGNAAACPGDMHQPDDHACSDNNACTIGDVCRAGACTAGGPPLVANMVDFGPALVLGAPRTAMLMLQWRDPASSVGVTALTASSSEFRVAAGEAFPIALSPAAASASVMMEFQPTAIGPRTATLTATLDPATCAIPVIDLVGTGSPAGLIANPGNNDFSQVEIGATSAPKIFQIVNLSGAEATIQSITVSDADNFALTADGLPAVTAADGTYSFTIVAKPKTAGVHDAEVVIASTSAMNPTLTVHVEGVCPGGVCGGGDGGVGAGGGDGGVGGGGGDGGVGGGNETPPAGPGAVSPLSCGAQSGTPGAGWLLIGLAFLVARRRVRRVAAC